MLTGRESLVRLIGRRRRSPLPASLGALLSPSSLASAQVEVKRPLSETPRNASPMPLGFWHLPVLIQANVDGSGSGEAASEAAGPSSGGGAEWVTCPVCGESIRGSDYCVNTHLGPSTNPFGLFWTVQSQMLSFATFARMNNGYTPRLNLFPWQKKATNLFALIHIWKCLTVWF
jgi:hypothetical protein